MAANGTTHTQTRAFVGAALGLVLHLPPRCALAVHVQ
jgi:hypothetical protein